MLTHDKPFEVTKAVDFSDAQIASTWVDLDPNPAGGFLHVVDPRAPMPMILLGGKGSGRTHLMRYYSVGVQRVRAGKRPLLETVCEEGYVGIYMRCEGLNAGRFAGKGQADSAWDDVFSYYMDLWLSQVAAQNLADVVSSAPDYAVRCAAVVRDVCSLFDTTIEPSGYSIDDLISKLRDLRREVDVAVNNAALSRSLSGLRILCTRGRLVFGVPKAFASRFPEVADLRILFLIDELENLTERQQIYVNTLIREKELPANFIVGSRLYGLRTRKTFSAGEENRQGSEFELVVLDDQLRSDSRYDDFARRLVAQRLVAAGRLDAVPKGSDLRPRLERYFAHPADSQFGELELQWLVDKYAGKERPYFAKLRGKLVEAIRGRYALGVANEADIDQVVGALSCPRFPLLEKTNTFLFYQDWSDGKNLIDAARLIGVECAALARGEEVSRHRTALSHFRNDLIAQVFRDAREDQRYVGLQSFIDMSAGLPRHLLIVLKFVDKWALFRGEDAFANGPISVAAQQAGVLQASTWFFEDARAVGDHSEAVHRGVERVANLFRNVRFSDKPAECSLIAFSFSEVDASVLAKQVIEHAAANSLLIRVLEGGKDRNDKGVHAKYQINPMLCPRYDLPLSRRGTMALTSDEIDAIFADPEPIRFEQVAAARLERMNAPFRRRSKVSVGQTNLPGLE